jgi:hypothetical protein
MSNGGAGVLIPQLSGGAAQQISSRIDAERNSLRW